MGSRLSKAELKGNSTPEMLEPPGGNGAAIRQETAEPPSRIADGKGPPLSERLSGLFQDIRRFTPCPPFIPERCPLTADAAHGRSCKKQPACRASPAYAAIAVYKKPLPALMTHKAALDETKRHGQEKIDRQIKTGAGQKHLKRRQRIAEKALGVAHHFGHGYG